ncbi:MAG: type II toxin-antitoxin system HicB family antitoxin [Halobacteria archaeon]
MSIDSDSNPNSSQTHEITLRKESKWWVAVDSDTGVSSQGKTKIEALENLEEAIEGYHGEGQQPTDNELEEIGIKPEENEFGSLDNSEVFK